MIVIVKMKHVTLRKGIYHFRMRIPADCIEEIGAKEKYESLNTTNAVDAQHAANKLAQELKAKFKSIRAKKLKPQPPLIPEKQKPNLINEVQGFQERMSNLAETALHEILEREDDDGLRTYSTHYRNQIEALRNPQPHFHFTLPELEMETPWISHKNKRIDRLQRKTVISTLQGIRKAIDKELGYEFSKEYDSSLAGSRSEYSGEPFTSNPDAVITGTNQTSVERDILKITKLMLSAKKRVKKGEDSIKSSVHALWEWCEGKKDICSYTKNDLIDFVRNCLPYIPRHRNIKKCYADLSLRQCIALTKKDPSTHIPISHTTCRNWQTNVNTVFNFAKDELGIIQINPAKNIEIPKVRVSKQNQRGFTSSELKTMWRTIQDVTHDKPHCPSFYWVPLLSLYHGLRLNEVASLFLKDVYQDEDGIFVLDINADGSHKSVKNKSSVRIIPVHPFLQDNLQFEEYVNLLKYERKEGLLFSELVYSQGHGYGRKISHWFNNWKKEWLSEESMYKHFHDLRYTFIQQAQNVAGIPDRHAQEITGHSIEGVSAVHLGYSGRLKPKALLEELQKISYGWE